MDIKIETERTDVKFAKFKDQYFSETAVTFAGSRPETAFQVGAYLEHVLMLDFQQEDVSLDVVLYTEIGSFYFQAFCLWKSHIDLSKSRQHKYVSLPEKIKSLLAKWKLAEHTKISTLNMCYFIWINDNYLKYHFVYRLKVTPCKHSFPLFDICSRYLSANDCHLFTFLMQKWKGRYLTENKNVQLFNWKEVSHACHKIGEYLPYFPSQADVDQLLAFLKLRTDISPLEALFIGLRSKPKVCKLSCSPLLHIIYLYIFVYLFHHACVALPTF